MSTLLLRLAGPMQSWGTQSSFTMRDTGLEPSKSGVIGLLCAALGRPRHEPLDDLVALRLGVRVDNEGRVARDYQTAEDVAKADGSTPQTVQSWRYYLADASFLVGLEGDPRLLVTLHQAVAQPVWPLSLGRLSYMPSLPVHLPDGLRADQDLRTALASYPWCPPPRQPPERLRLIIDGDDPAAGPPRQDVPLSFAYRRFGVRYPLVEWLSASDLTMTEETLPCI